MRLLMFGHWSHTGFGVVTQEIGGRLLALGHDVRVIAVNHRGEPTPGPLLGRVWPAAMYGSPYGGDISSPAIRGQFWRMFDHEDDWRPDAVLVVADMSGLFGHMGREGLTGGWTEVPVYHYCPIEGDNLNPSWRDVWKIIRPVAMSEYGRRVISDFIGRDVPMIYHGVDTSVFRPATFTEPLVWGEHRIHSREEAVKVFGGDPRRQYVLRTDRFVERKFYPALLAAMVPVFEQRADVDLIIHCRAIDEGASLFDEINRLPEHLRGRVVLTNAHDTWQGLPTVGLAALMNAATLYVSTSSEGFGLNLAEAMACEVPVVALGHSAVIEVVGPGGVLVPPLHDRYGNPIPYHSRYGMDWGQPDVPAYTDAILRLLDRPAERRSLGKAGRMHVRRSFSWDRAADQFDALLTEEPPDALGIAV